MMNRQEVAGEILVWGPEIYLKSKVLQVRMQEV